MNIIIKEFEKEITNLIRFGHHDPRTYIINPNKKVIYLNNSKVACTSLKVSLFDYNVEDNMTIHLILKHKKNEIQKKDYPNYFSFTYIRNPFERLVSCYKNKICKEKHYYDTYLGGFLLPKEGFENFVKKTLLIPDWLADRHFQSQYSLIYKKGQCTVDFIGKIETIEKSYPKLAKKYNLSPLKHYNVSPKSNWMDYYTIPIARKVYKRYKIDFKKFKYDNYYDDLLNYLKNK